VTAKFQIIINDLDEKTLGPVLGALPNGITPEIRRISARPIPSVANVIHNKGESNSYKSKDEMLASWIKQMPQPFASPELVPLIVASGHAAGSITHFLRRAIHAGMIRKVPGTAGTLTRYEKLKA